MPSAGHMTTVGLTSKMRVNSLPCTPSRVWKRTVRWCDNALIWRARVGVCVQERENPATSADSPWTVYRSSLVRRVDFAPRASWEELGVAQVYALAEKKKEEKKAGNKRPTPQMRANTLNPWQTFLHERCTIAAPPSPSYSGKVAPLSLQQRVGYRCGFVRAASTVRKQIEPDHRWEFVRGRNESIHAGPRWRLARSVAKWPPVTWMGQAGDRLCVSSCKRPQGAG